MRDYVIAAIKVGTSGFEDGAIVSVIDQDIWNPIITKEATEIFLYAKFSRAECEKELRLGLLPLYDASLKEIKPRRKRIDLSEFETALGQPGLELGLRSKGSIPIVDATMLKVSIIIDATDEILPYKFDLNSITSGSANVGSAETYTTWALAGADLGNLTGSLTFTQTTAITDTASFSPFGIQIGSNTFTLTSDTPPNGDPTVGNVWTWVGPGGASALRFRFVTTASSIVEFKNFNIDATGSGATSAIFLIENTFSDVGTHNIHDNIFNGGGGPRRGFDLRNDSATLFVWNNKIFNITGSGSGRGIFIITDALHANSRIENNSIEGCNVGIDANSFSGVYNNNACINNGLDFKNLSAATGSNNASEDTTAGDGNWSTGANNEISITPANEFVSLIDTNSDFLKVKIGGVCDDGGKTPDIAANTKGIAGNNRPGSDSLVSIGADELEITGTDFELTSVNPSSATFKGNTSTSIIGTGFDDITYTIDIDGNACTDIVRVSSTELTCVTPPSTTSGSKTLTVDGGGDNETISFTYLKAKRITILEEFETALATILTGSGFNFDIPSDKIIREPHEIKRFNRLSLPVLFLKSGEQEGIVPISNGGYRNTFVIQVHGIISADADLSRDGNQSDEYEKLKEDIRESIMSHFKTGSFSDFVIQITPIIVEKSEIFEEAMRMNLEIIYDNTFTVI